MYVLLTQTWTVTYYVTDLSSRQGERPTKNKTAAVLNATRIWSWVPEGPAAKTDWLTDWQLQSNSDSNCICCLTQAGTATCYMTDASSRHWGRPRTNKTAAILTTITIWSLVLEGTRRQDGPTDRPSVVRWLTLYTYWPKCLPPSVKIIRTPVNNIYRASSRLASFALRRVDVVALDSSS